MGRNLMLEWKPYWSSSKCSKRSFPCCRAYSLVLRWSFGRSTRGDNDSEVDAMASLGERTRLCWNVILWHTAHTDSKNVCLTFAYDNIHIPRMLTVGGQCKSHIDNAFWRSEKGQSISAGISITNQMKFV